MKTIHDCFQEMINSGEVLTCHLNGEPRQVIGYIKFFGYREDTKTIELLSSDNKLVHWKVNILRKDDNTRRSMNLGFVRDYRIDRPMRKLQQEGFYRPDRTLKRVDLFYLNSPRKWMEFFYYSDYTLKRVRCYYPDGTLQRVEIHRSNGNLKRTKEYYPDGTLYLDYSYCSNGNLKRAKEYYPDGTLHFDKLLCSDGEIVKAVKMYKEDGTLYEPLSFSSRGPC